MSDHIVTNTGKTPIRVIDTFRGVRNVAPGTTITVNLLAIYCDNGPARYSVEPVKE